MVIYPQTSGRHPTYGAQRQLRWLTTRRAQIAAWLDFEPTPGTTVKDTYKKSRRSLGGKIARLTGIEILACLAM